MENEETNDHYLLHCPLFSTNLRSFDLTNWLIFPTHSCLGRSSLCTEQQQQPPIHPPPPTPSFYNFVLPIYKIQYYWFIFSHKLSHQLYVLNSKCLSSNWRWINIYVVKLVSKSYFYWLFDAIVHIVKRKMK